MADDPQGRPGWFFIELFALGAVLHGFDIMSANGFQASMAWWIGGSVLAIVGWHWNRIKPLLGPRFEQTEREVINNFRWWAVTALVIFVLPGLSRYTETFWAIYNRIGDPPSVILGLTDAKRFRFIKAFFDTGPTVACIARGSVKPDSKSADGLWLEFEPLLIYAGWKVYGGGAGMPFYRDGIMIKTGPNPRGDSLACATRLASEIQPFVSVNVSIKGEQVTPNLESCQNECVDIQIGDAR
ncbi:MAG: hypothetical protein JO007_13425 [Alphaproteobacteria bacterium]|nr:hypothetical protein [Alphaproteobacteria bacterium]